MNRHRQFIDQHWKMLTAGYDTTPIRDAYREVTGRPAPDIEIGHALWLGGWYHPYADQGQEPPDAWRTIEEYKAYLDDRFNHDDPVPPPDIPPLPSGTILGDFLARGLVTQTLPQRPRMEQEAFLNRYAADPQHFRDLCCGFGLSVHDKTYGDHFPVDIRRPAHLANLITTCQLAHDRGLRVTVWGLCDELGSAWHNNETEIIKFYRTILPKIRPHIDRFVPALEMTETIGSDAWHRILPIVNDLLQGVPYFVHWNAGINAGTTFEGIDGIYYQYLGDTVSKVQAETRSILQKWRGHPGIVVAAEFPFHAVMNNPAMAKKLGDAAQAAGAQGRANG